IWEPTQERLISCHTEIIRLNKIVDQLKELYLLENKKDILTMKYFDIFELCKAVSKEFEIKVQDKRIYLNIKIPNFAMVYGDETRIKQCLINLVSNAINYGAVEGDITVMYEKLDNHTILTVSDNGPGILEEDLPYVFERFYRVDKSRNKNTGGMGIGLAITKAIVDAHGGIITVESHVGVGSTFKISLPLPENLI
ncbi:MAG: HAMP domain-containing sensor histidine kinase, partial [Mobilitalea sp.]